VNQRLSTTFLYQSCEQLLLQIVLKLVEQKKVDLIFCTSGKEYVKCKQNSWLELLNSILLRYITPSQLYKEMEDEVHAAGGCLK